MKNANLGVHDLTEIVKIHEELKKGFNRIFPSEKPISTDEEYASRVEWIVEDSVYDENENELDDNQRALIKLYSEAFLFKDLKNTLAQNNINLNALNPSLKLTEVPEQIESAYQKYRTNHNCLVELLSHVCPNQFNLRF